MMAPTARHFRFGTLKISGRWIFVGLSVVSACFHLLTNSSATSGCRWDDGGALC